MVGYRVLEAQMKSNKIFSIFTGLALIAASVCFAQNSLSWPLEQRHSQEAARSKCYVLDSQFRPNRDKADEQCSVAACTSGYNPTAFSPEQANICAAERKKHPQPKSVWKVYKAANGEYFRANIGTARRTQLGVIVMGQIQGEDIVAKPMIFDCAGHFMFFIDNDETGTSSSGWQLAPSHSVIGAIAKDVCAKR